MAPGQSLPHYDPQHAHIFSSRPSKPAFSHWVQVQESTQQRRSGEGERGKAKRITEPKYWGCMVRGWGSKVRSFVGNG